MNVDEKADAVKNALEEMRLPRNEFRLVKEVSDAPIPVVVIAPTSAYFQLDRIADEIESRTTLTAAVEDSSAFKFQTIRVQ